MKALPVTVQKLKLRLQFSKCRSTVNVKTIGTNGSVLSQGKHVKYESPICYGSVFMVKINVFKLKVKGQDHKVKHFETDEKV